MLWRWNEAEHTSISCKLVKIVYLIAMASLVNNFLSYLDFGIRAKWSREKEKKHSIKSSSSTTATATATINDKNSVRVSTHVKERGERRRVYFMRAYFQYYYRNVTIIFDWQDMYMCDGCVWVRAFARYNFKKVMTVTNRNANRSKATLIYILTHGWFSHK